MDPPIFREQQQQKLLKIGTAIAVNEITLRMLTDY